jgi:hypothetical protein
VIDAVDHGIAASCRVMVLGPVAPKGAPYAGLTPTHLDWHCLADGVRADIFDVTLMLADEYGIAVRAWLEPARQKRRAGGCRWSATTSRGSVRPTTNFWPPGGPEEEGITVIGWSTLLEQWQHPPGTAAAR